MLDVLLGCSARCWTERAQTSPWQASCILKKKTLTQHTRGCDTRVTQNTHSLKFNTCAQTHPGCTRCRCTEPWCPQQSPCCAPTPCLICPADHVNSRVEEGAMTSTGGEHDAVATARSESLQSIGFKNKLKKTLHSCKLCNQIWKTHRRTLKKHNDRIF